MVRPALILFALSYWVAPAPDATPAEALRAANAAVRGGNPTLAARLYDRCEERSDDPGLLAFNRAVACAAAGDYREAELNYLRCLEDRAIPEGRRVQAIYNRGVCLLYRGEDAKLLRVAVGCFQECVDTLPAENPLYADARHNLELAKLLWGRARAKQKDVPTPNDPFDQDPPPAKSTPTTPDDLGPEQNPNPQTVGTPGDPQPNPQTSPRPGTMPTATTPQKAPGTGTAPVVSGDAAEVQKLSPEDTKLLLDRTDSRLRQARQKNEQMRAGPERPNVRDW